MLVNENVDDNEEFEKFRSLLVCNKILFDSTSNELYKNQQTIKKPTRKLSVGTAFSGIGAIEHALSILNIPHEISFACDNGGILFEDIASKEDIEKLALITDKKEKLDFVECVYKKSRKNNFVKQSYLTNYNLDEENFYHDVRFLGSHIQKKIDIFVGGSPCQSFSIAGKRGGFEDTRGTLFFEFARCIKEFQPEVFIYENVKGLLSHDNGRTFETVLNTFNELGYKYFYKTLNAKDYGVPQSRPRIFVIGFKNHDINFEFPKPIELKSKMSDFLLGKVDKKYLLSENQALYVKDTKKLKKKYTQINGEISLCQKACQQYNLQGDFVEENYYLSSKLVNYVITEGAKKSKLIHLLIQTLLRHCLQA